jgi:hypothetical protein
LLALSPAIAKRRGVIYGAIDQLLLLAQPGAQALE